MKKFLLSLLTIGLLVGCSSKSEEKDILSDDKQTTSNNTDTQNVKLPTMYEVDQSEKLELGTKTYYIYEPLVIGYKYNRTGLLYMSFNDINSNQIGVQVLSLELPEFGKEEYNTLEKISGEHSKIAMGRDVYLTTIEKGFSKLNYQINPISTNLDGRTAVLNKGVAYEVSNEDKTLNYAMFDFFLDEEKNYPCEVILTSSDGVSPDDLEAMARELIGTIQSE